MKQIKALKFKNEHGVSALLITLLLPLLFGFIAFGIDVGHLLVVRNELHRAADAGALAGAQFLLNDDGTAINEGCNQIAEDTAIANMSEKQAVEVEDGDVQRGHWSFATRTFTPNNSTVMVPIWGVSFEELDVNPDFINAVRVETWRGKEGLTGALKAASFFVRVFNPDFAGFTVRKHAVAYLGFAGTLNPGEADAPLGICESAITEIIDGKKVYSCSVGTLIPATTDTGLWTNFSQDPCSTANPPSTEACKGNPGQLLYGDGTGTTEGFAKPIYEGVKNCWSKATGMVEPWQITLPVFDCSEGVPNCRPLVGAVKVNIMWMTGWGEDPHYNNVPTQMDGGETGYPSWTTDPAKTGEQNWNDFADNFHLKDYDKITRAKYEKKTVYFLPDCNPHEPTGVTGGDNFGIRAKIPVLVE